MLSVSYNKCVKRLSTRTSRPVDRQVVVFPHAGGTFSFFKELRQYLPGNVDLLIVQYPNREERMSTEMWSKPSDAISEICDGLSCLLGRAPTTFFGHSMGAVIASHTAIALKNTRFMPVDVIISSQMTPSALKRLLSNKSDVDALVDELITQDEASGTVKYDDLTKPIIHNRLLTDILLLRQFSILPYDKCLPIRVFGGLSDNFVTKHQIEQWVGYTDRPLSLTFFEGAHFYLRNQLPRLAGKILEAQPVIHAGCADQKHTKNTGDENVKEA